MSSIGPITFDGQPNGTAATTATSDDNGDVVQTWSKGTGGTGTYTSADFAHGSGSVELQSTTANTSTVLFDVDDVGAAASAWSIAFYMKWLAYPSVTNDQMPCGLRSIASGALGRLDSSLSGQLRLNIGASITSYSTAMATGTWYRCEFYGTGAGTAATAANLDVYVGDNTGTPFTQVSLTGATTAAAIDRVRYGRFSASNLASMQCRIDSIRQVLGSSTPLGPMPSNPGINQLGYRSLWSPAAAIQAATR